MFQMKFTHNNIIPVIKTTPLLPPVTRGRGMDGATTRTVGKDMFEIIRGGNTSCNHCGYKASF